MKKTCLLIIPFLMLGCASSSSRGLFGRRDRSIKTASYEMKIAEAKTISVITDACITRDKVLGKDYFSIKSSLSAASNMENETVEYLKKKGYEITSHNSPFACGFKDPEGIFFVKIDAPEGASGDKKELSPPFFMDTSLSDDQNYSDALKRLLHNSILAIQQKEKPPSVLFSKRKNSFSDVQIVNKHQGDADLILVVMGNGRGVPWGKQAVQDIASTVVSSIAISVLTGGMYSGHVSAQNVSYLDTYAGLIDARSGELIWSNSSRIKEFDADKKAVYRTIIGIPKWAGRYFDTLPDKHITPSEG